MFISVYQRKTLGLLTKNFEHGCQHCILRVQKKIWVEFFRRKKCYLFLSELEQRLSSIVVKTAFCRGVFRPKKQLDECWTKKLRNFDSQHSECRPLKTRDGFSLNEQGTSFSHETRTLYRLNVSTLKNFCKCVYWIKIFKVESLVRWTVFPPEFNIAVVICQSFELHWIPSLHILIELFLSTITSNRFFSFIGQRNYLPFH